MERADKQKFQYKHLKIELTEEELKELSKLLTITVADMVTGANQKKKRAV